MNRKHFALGLVAIGVVGNAPAAPSTEQVGPETSIPFVDNDGIRDFDVVDRNTLYLEGRGGQWYRVKTAGPCPDLPYAIGIGVDTDVGDTLSRGEALIVEGRRCPIASLVKSGEPPKKQRRD